MKKSTYYLPEEFEERMDNYIKQAKLKSRNEFFEKSGTFYLDYTENKDPGEFLAKEIQAIMTGNMELVEKRLGNRFAKLLSDIAIQLGIQQQIFKSITNITEEDISLYRKIAVDDIKNNQRIIKYDDLK
jgi:hypothetical protein